MYDIDDIIVWQGCITRYLTVWNLADDEEIRLASIDEMYRYLARI